MYVIFLFLIYGVEESRTVRHSREFGWVIDMSLRGVVLRYLLPG